MAITNNGTVNNLDPNQIPTGYSKPSVTTFNDWETERTLNLNVLKATVENVDPAVTMANILANATVGVNKQIDDILAAEYLATATVTAYAVLEHLSTNFASIAKTGAFLTNAAANYVCRVKLYVKAE